MSEIRPDHSILKGTIKAQDPMEADFLFRQLYDYESIQLESSEYSREVTFCASESFVTYKASTGAPLYSAGTGIGNRLIIALMDQEFPSSWWGKKIASNQLPYLVPGSELELLEPAAHDLLSFAWDLDFLRDLASSTAIVQPSKLNQFLDSISQPPHLLCDHQQLGPHWYKFFETQISGAICGVESVSPEKLESLGVGFLLSMLESFSDAKVPPMTRHQRHELVRQAIEYDDSQRSYGCSIPSISGHLSCSRRSLELAFNETVSTSPLQFLTRRRLNAMYKDLLRSDPDTTTVTEIAMSAGFTEMGRCAARFKKLFNATPSDILRKNPVTSGLTVPLTH